MKTYTKKQDKRKSQAEITVLTGLSRAYICQIANSVRIPGWPAAEKLAEATDTTPQWWMSANRRKMKTVFLPPRKKNKNPKK